MRVMAIVFIAKRIGSKFERSTQFLSEWWLGGKLKYSLNPILSSNQVDDDDDLSCQTSDYSTSIWFKSVEVLFPGTWLIPKKSNRDSSSAHRGDVNLTSFWLSSTAPWRISVPFWGCHWPPVGSSESRKINGVFPVQCFPLQRMGSERKVICQIFTWTWEWLPKSFKFCSLTACEQQSSWIIWRLAPHLQFDGKLRKLWNAEVIHDVFWHISNENMTN